MGTASKEIKIDLSKDKACGFEGWQGRPIICPNNPDRIGSENYSPRTCLKCPSDSKAISNLQAEVDKV